jgi:hypothetical protein
MYFTAKKILSIQYYPSFFMKVKKKKLLPDFPQVCEPGSPEPAGRSWTSGPSSEGLPA